MSSKGAQVPPRAHTHRFSGQSITHRHGSDEVRRDVTFAEHGYFGHVQDQPGVELGSVETRGVRHS